MTTSTTLFSQHLSSPQLRFDYALRIQVANTPFSGFRRWGPYDKNQPRKNRIACAMIYPPWATPEARKLREALLNGMFAFAGFEAFSKGVFIADIEMVIVNATQTDSPLTQSHLYGEKASELAQSFDYDLVLGVIPQTPHYIYDSPYYAAKLTLAANGIPCQLVTLEKLRSDETFKWSLANIALQIYAKLGFVPWVVETPDIPQDLIIGVGRREVREGRIGTTKRYMGFTTAYKNNGAFLSFNGIVPANAGNSYHELLSEAIAKALIDFRDIQSRQNLPTTNPDRVVFHSFKKIGVNEIEAIEAGIRRGSQSQVLLPYALLHIDGSNNFLLFDDSDRSYLPKSGFVASLGPLHALLLTEGRERYEHRKVGFPTPLVIRLDPRSKLETENLVDAFPGLVEQVYGLSKVNWRGFNAAAIPITLGYARLIADVMASCPTPDLWAQIATAENLRDKAWFL